MDLNTIQNEMTQAESSLKQYQDPALLGQAKDAVMKQWTPLLQSATNAAQGMMSSFLPNYMGLSQQLGGTSEADLSPTQKLQFMGQRMGDMSGQLYKATALADYYGGKAQTMAAAAQDALKWGNQQAAAAYERAFQRYNLAWQEAENEKSRQAQIKAAQIASAPQYIDNSGGGGGMTNVNGDGYAEVPDSTAGGSPSSPNILEAIYKRTPIGAAVGLGATAIGSGGNMGTITDYLKNSYPELYGAYKYVTGAGDRTKAIMGKSFGGGAGGVGANMNRFLK